MNKYIAIFITLNLSFSLFSQTPVNGDQSGTWSVTNSPYEVMSEITVPTGQTLTIEAGVEINFKGYYKFNVDGKIIATGTTDNIIKFTTDNQSIGWGGVRLDGTNDISSFTYCTFEYGKTSTGSYPDIHGGAILLLNANAEFYNCIFAHNNANGDDNGIGGAVYAFNTGTSTETLTKFIDCQFIENHAYGEGGAIRLTNDGHTEITNCQFINNNCGYGGGAIHVYTALDTSFTNCLFYNNYSTTSGGGAIKTLNPSSTMNFTNCTFANNHAYGSGEGGALDLSHADVTLINSIVYENTQTYGDEINIGIGASAVINYSNLEMPSSATGSNNINTNPLFIDAVNGDYHLQSTSACIDAGIDVGLPFVGTAPDMGCYEFGTTSGTEEYSTAINLYPNPSKGFLTIGSITPIKQIKLFNSLGVLVYEMTFKNNLITPKIDISNLNKGVYHIQVNTTDLEVFAEKIILTD